MKHVVTLPMCGALLASGGAERVELEASRPNVILFFIDDVGIEAIGTFGSEIETPT